MNSKLVVLFEKGPESAAADDVPDTMTNKPNLAIAYSNGLQQHDTLSSSRLCQLPSFLGSALIGEYTFKEPFELT